jgi:hypothetical protein
MVAQILLAGRLTVCGGHPPVALPGDAAMPDPITPPAKPQHSVRWPVKQAKVESYLILSLTVFAVTVILTRMYLQMTGYPQLGNGVLHIAHALWGGLLLVMAAWVPLILANNWALPLSAVLSGMGVGLFIDEVGKFITRQNDYFFPAAAPVIYGFFMLLVLVVVVVQKAGRDHPRNELYRALTELRELVDFDLDERERQALLQHLAAAQESPQPQVAGLAAALHTYLLDTAIPLAPPKTGLGDRLTAILKHVAARVGRRRHRDLIILAMALTVAGTALGILALLLAAWTTHTSIPALFHLFLTQDEIAGANNGFWFYLRIALQLLVSVLALVSVILLYAKRDRPGIRAAYVALLLSLTGGTLLAFYMDQFRAVTTALYQFSVLLLVLAYRQWYLTGHAPPVY